LPYNQAIPTIEAVIDALQNSNPDVTILIEQLPPARSDILTPELTNYFDQLKQGVAMIALESTTNSS
jgi:hypothetical protein